MYSLEEERVQYDEDKKIFIRSNDKLTSGAMCYFTPVIVLRQGV